MKKRCVKKMTRVKRKSISLTTSYVDKIAKIREKLGLSSDSEVVRRAIDEYATKYGIE